MEAITIHNIKNAETLEYNDLLEENRILRNEIRVAREAGEITADLVVKQFEETERILRRFQSANAQRKAVLNSASQISIIATDIKGYIIVFNSGAEKLLGYQADEVIRKQTPELFHLDSELDLLKQRLDPKNKTAYNYIDVFFEYAERDENEHHEMTYVKSDGSTFPVSLSINPLRDADRAITGFLCIAMDISDIKRSEKALKESERKYRMLVENLYSVVFKGYTDGSMDVFDDKIETLTGYQKEDFLSRKLKWPELIIEKDRPNVKETFVEALKKDQSYIREYRIQKKDGRIIWIEELGQIELNEKGEIEYITGSFLNVTERKNQEEKLKKAYDELELRIAERTADLEKANEELKKEIRERRHAEEALRENEQKLEGIMASITDRMSMIDEDYNIVWANKFAKKIFGEDIIGKKCYEAYAKRNDLCSNCVVTKTFADGQVHERESEAFDKSNERMVFWVTASVTARHKDGRPRLVVENSRNITARKRAEEALLASEEKYRSIFENATEGIFQTSPTGEILTVNPALIRILGYDSLDDLRNSIKSIRYDVYVDPEVPGEFMKQLNQNRRVKDFETRFKRKDNSIIDVSINAHAVKDESGNTLYYEGVLQDITEKKRIEELRIGKEAAEASTKAKSDFLANMSHEIRTPLNAITGMTELALNTELTPKQLDYLEKIKISSHSLLGIINDILDFSRIEAGKLKLENTDFHLNDLLENLMDIFSNRDPDKDIEILFTVDENVPAGLTGDPLRLGQVLTNLVSNAIKFTEKGEIVVSVSLEKSDSQKANLLFSVRDTGVGIPEEYLPRLFASFTQADDSTTRRYGGTGLGLAICKRIVEMMDGDIHVESKIGKGTTFTFTACLGISDQPKDKSFYPPSFLSNLKVLVIDDFKTAQEILKDMLTSFNFNVSLSDSGRQALDELASCPEDKPYQLIILDWKMPGMDGIETLKKIRKVPGYSSIPVILMTAYGREEVIQKGKAAGADAYLIKPVKKSLLFDTIIKLFDHKPDYEEFLNKTPDYMKRQFDGAKILVVEDNPINRQVATELLENTGAVVETAENGSEAISLIEQNRYDLVLMDVQMPTMDGFEATRLIREKPRFENLPVIAMTAHAMKGDREKCIQSGMNDYISKPIHFEKLYDTLLNWLPENIQTPEPEPEPAPFPSVADSRETLFYPLPGIDIEASIKGILTSIDVLGEILNQFRENHSEAASDIRKALREGDAKTARNIAHNIKGVSGIFCAKNLQNKALSLEKAIEEDDAESIENRLIDFENAMDEVQKSIETFNRMQKEKNENRTEKPQPKMDLEKFIITLLELLQNNDMEAQDLIKDIKTIFLTHSLEKHADDLIFMIKNLEYQKACDFLQALAEENNISTEKTTPIKKLRRQKILIVDDSPVNIHALWDALKQEYRISYATSGKEALLLAMDRESFDLILLDVVMPGMNGYEVCNRLKSEKRTKHIPVIFITARSENEDEMKGLEVGAVDYIRKPFNQAVVKARVKAHLELKMHRDKLELDGLTGIPNRRRFDEYIETEWRMASRENSNISLIMIDIDYFKNFNDGYGHLSGDECLKKVAATLAKSVNRPMDFVARYGGEEFACILPGTDLNGAIYIAETMKKNIERLTITHDYSLIGNYLTISLGVATIVPSMHFSYNVLIEGADEALFMAKKSGRNRIHHLNLNESPE